MQQADPTSPENNVAAADAPAGDAALVVDSLNHTYAPGRRGQAGVAALDNVSLHVQPGELFGVLGPNGGGKSTLFKVLTTAMRPAGGGSVRLFGVDALAQPRLAREQVGVVFQSPSLDIKLTARENLLHHGRLYSLGGPELRDRIGQLLTDFELSDRADEYVERFSGGMRRRVELAKAMLTRPRLLLMDEPSTGLDPGARAQLWRLVDRLRETDGVTVVMTTHLMDEGDRCDRLAILASGQIVAQGTPTSIKATIGGDVLLIEPTGDAEAAEQLRQQIDERFGPWADEKARPQLVDGRVRLEHADGPALVPTLSAAFPERVRSISVGQPTLEDALLHLTGQRLGGDEPPAPAKRSRH